MSGKPDKTISMSSQPDQSVPEAGQKDSPRHLWHQQSDESAKAYATFLEYLEFGPDFTLEQVAESTGKSKDAIWKLSSRHHWLDRAAAWRRHLADAASALVERTVGSNSALGSVRADIVCQEHWEDAQQLRRLARYILNKELNNPSAKCSIFELSHLFHTSSKLSSLSLAKPGSGPKPDQASASDADVDFENALKKAYGPAAASTNGKDGVPSVPNQSPVPDGKDGCEADVRLPCVPNQKPASLMFGTQGTASLPKP